MNRYRFLYAYWFIPTWLLFLAVQQIMVHQGAMDTFKNGTTYIAEITDFDLKQMGAQSNGYVDIRFVADGEVIQRRMSLSVQMAQKLMEAPNIPIRYQKGARQDIVLYPTYEIQRDTSFYNMTIAVVGLIITAILGLYVNRYVKRKSATPDDEKFIINRVD
jgi:hypothetical protein